MSKWVAGRAVPLCVAAPASRTSADAWTAMPTVWLPTVPTQGPVAPSVADQWCAATCVLVPSSVAHQSLPAGAWGVSVLMTRSLFWAQQWSDSLLQWLV